MSSSTLIYEWLRSHDTVLMWMGILSAVMFLSTLLAVPFIVSRIPTDYFIRAHRPPRYTPISPSHLLWITFKNAVGIILFVAGIAMLVLPGQGVLTMLLGVMLMNFPGKYELERQIIQQPTILKALNWMRRRANRPDLIVELPHSTDEALR